MPKHVSHTESVRHKKALFKRIHDACTMSTLIQVRCCFVLINLCEERDVLQSNFHVSSHKTNQSYPVFFFQEQYGWWIYQPSWTFDKTRTILIHGCSTFLCRCRQTTREVIAKRYQSQNYKSKSSHDLFQHRSH